MSSYIRKRVSQNRKRLKDGKYDLDLTYITNNIIAMGYPSDKTLQKIIRNEIGKVSKFLNERHEDSYKIFNLCDETDYDVSYFNHMVELIPVVDHCPPRFEQIQQFCSCMYKWLYESENNVAIVHCKAGKGRTGTMISCYFIYSGLFPNPFEAIYEFNCRRCDDQKGVTIPSQLRYIEYYADFVLNKRSYMSTELFLKSIKIDATSQSNDFIEKIACLNLINMKTRKSIFKSDNMNINSNRIYFFEILNPIQFVDDVIFSFESKKQNCLMKMFMNTFCFMQENKYSVYERSYTGRKFKLNGKKQSIFWQLKKKQIDIAHKNKEIDAEFNITFEFEYDVEKFRQQSQQQKLDRQQSFRLETERSEHMIDDKMILLKKPPLIVEPPLNNRILFEISTNDDDDQEKPNKNRDDDEDDDVDDDDDEQQYEDYEHDSSSDDREKKASLDETKSSSNNGKVNTSLAVKLKKSSSNLLRSIKKLNTSTSLRSKKPIRSNSEPNAESMMINHHTPSNHSNSSMAFGDSSNSNGNGKTLSPPSQSTSLLNSPTNARSKLYSPNSVTDTQLNRKPQTNHNSSGSSSHRSSSKEVEFRYLNSSDQTNKHKSKFKSFKKFFF